MVDVTVANETEHSLQIREIFWEYLQWMNANVYKEYGVKFDIQAKIDDDMATLAKFMRPKGCLLLGLEGGQAAGIICMQELYGETGEIRRLYVCPEFRHNGLGRALIERMLEEASKIGYRKIRLDSARFMVDAHRLYRSAGFREIEAYPGSEIPDDFQKYWIFMEKSLVD